MTTMTRVQARQRFQRPALDEIGEPTNGTFLSNVCPSTHSLQRVGPINCSPPLRGLWGKQDTQEREARGRCLRFAATSWAGKRVAVYYPRPGAAGYRSTRGAAQGQIRLPRRPTTLPPTRSRGPSGLRPRIPHPKSPRRPGLSSLARMLRILTGRPLRVDRTSRWRRKLHPA